MGNPIGVIDPNGGQSLAYVLEGAGADNFAVAKVSDGVQIEVAADADLDYEATASYDLTLTVSDGVDHDGNADPSVDDSIKLRINITNMVEPLTITLSPDDVFSPTTGSNRYRLRFELNDHDDYGQLHYTQHEADNDGSNESHASGVLPLHLNYSRRARSPDRTHDQEILGRDLGR